jgi:signal transduction histidine kinase
MNDLPAQKLVFFGTITASLSHELKNALATINEFSGLLDDLTQGAAAGRSLSPERLQSVCGKIAKQIRRGEMLIQRLNRFAHSVDEPRREVDVTELLGQICDLCGRFADLKQVVLERQLPDEPVSLTLDPFAFQYAVYLGIDLALQSAGEKRVVTVSLAKATSGYEVAVASADPIAADAGETAGRLSMLQQVLQHLGGEAVAGGDRIVLTLP